jgi:hypothetical protein
MSSIAAGTTTGSALVSTGDTTGELVLKTNGTTTAVTIDTSQNVTIEGDLTVNGAFSGTVDVDTVTGTLDVANGGTGATTLTANNVILGNGTSAVSFVAPGSNGNVLTSNGTTWTSAAAAGGGGDYIMRTYTSPATWSKPANLKAVKVTLVGGGGGGAVNNPGPGQSGGAGGTSSFGAFLSATGGAGATVPANGAAGSGSGGDINVSGGPGDMVLGLYRPSGAFFNVAGVRQAALAQYIGTPIGGGGGVPDGTTQRNGGGGGGSIEYISAPSIPGPVTVTVGAGGIVTGPAPTQPFRNAGAGAAGIVVVEEFY